MDLYIALKRHLRNTGWTILGGQPPSGSDHLPVIEIKLNHGLAKGSKDSYKPDLMAIRRDQLMLFEIKPGYSQNDFEKLEAILNSQQRIQSLWNEIRERKLRDSKGDFLHSELERTDIQCALAYAAPAKRVTKVWTFLFENGSFIEIEPDDDKPTMS